jgi:hypothetical protein
MNGGNTAKRVLAAISVIHLSNQSRKGYIAYAASLSRLFLGKKKLQYSYRDTLGIQLDHPGFIGKWLQYSYRDIPGTSGQIIVSHLFRNSQLPGILHRPYQILRRCHWGCYGTQSCPRISVVFLEKKMTCITWLFQNLNFVRFLATIYTRVVDQYWFLDPDPAF